MAESKFNEHIDQSYCYPIDVVSVYDGDTITCNIHLGFGVILSNQKIRLFGIDTPELRGGEREEGIKSRDFLRNEILEGDIKMYSIKDKKGKYGRYLGIIYKGDTNINNLLIKNGLAKSYFL